MADQKQTSDELKCPECGCRKLIIDIVILAAMDGCKTCDKNLEEYQKRKANK